MSRLKRVYIAHPYSDNPEEAFKKVDAIVKDLFFCNPANDVLPISPIHLFSWLENDSDVRNDLLQACTELIKTCDELWFYGLSAGVKFEIEKAKELGIKVVCMY